MICTGGQLVFFNDLNFQIIEVYLFNEIILCKARPAMSLEVRNRRFQPDGLTKIELHTDFIQSVEYFMSAGIIAAIFDDSIL